jgi:hypothetical protein
MEHGPQRQSRHDRQRRIPSLPASVCPGAACLAAIASSLNHTVRLPRWRKLASYAAQFVTLRFCFGMLWRRAALALNGMVESQIKQGLPSYPSQLTAPTGDPCKNAAWATLTLIDTPIGLASNMATRPSWFRPPELLPIWRDIKTNQYPATIYLRIKLTAMDQRLCSSLPLRSRHPAQRRK